MNVTISFNYTERIKENPYKKIDRYSEISVKNLSDIELDKAYKNSLRDSVALGKIVRVDPSLWAEKMIRGMKINNIK